MKNQGDKDTTLAAQPIASPRPAQQQGKIEQWDKFIHKRLTHICVVNFTSINGDVNYRIKGQRHSRMSTEKNFLKNWTPLNVPARDAGTSE